jgi:hypothetical protein
MGHNDHMDEYRPELPPEAGKNSHLGFEPDDHWLATADPELQREAMRIWFVTRYWDPANDTPYNGQEGVRSRVGSVRTLAASHHQRNQAVETSLVRHMLCGTCDARDRREIKWLPVLGVRKSPFIEVTPYRKSEEQRRN